MKLIYAEALKEYVLRAGNHWHSDWDAMSICKAVDAQPTIGLDDVIIGGFSGRQLALAFELCMKHGIRPEDMKECSENFAFVWEIFAKEQESALNRAFQQKFFQFGHLKGQFDHPAKLKGVVIKRREEHDDQ